MSEKFVLAIALIKEILSLINELIKALKNPPQKFEIAGGFKPFRFVFRPNKTEVW